MNDLKRGFGGDDDLDDVNPNKAHLQDPRMSDKRGNMFIRDNNG